MSDNKCVNLTREPQRRAFSEAKRHAENETGRDLTDGEAVQEMAEAYNGTRYPVDWRGDA